jgi:Bacterial Ig-like domain (group 1)
MQQRSFRYTRWLVPALGGALLLSSAACDDKITNSLVLVATNISVSTASNGQIGVAGQALPQPIVVHVSDQNGASLANAVVAWTIVSGGGSVSSSTSLTDGSGNASVTWTLGPAVGVDSLRAAIATGASVNITATATSGVAATINKTSGDNQTISVNSTSAPMVVTVVDQLGNPVANATVTWSATGTGTLSATTTTTDAAGHAQVTLATGAAPETAVVTASSNGLASVNFTITSVGPQQTGN